MALGLELSSVELSALEATDPSAIQRFAQALDARLQKALLVSVAAAEPAAPSHDEKAR
jgi:hypothetical protein